MRLSVKFFPGVLMCVLLLSLFAAAEETGDLQITYKPGIRMYLDDQFAGITMEQDGGLLLHGISPGIHKVRGENTEFIPSEFRVSIMAGKMTQIKIGEDGAPMIVIQAGEFQMGDHFNEGDGSERPAHTVYLDAFYMDIHEVTNAQYQKFIDATGHRMPSYWNGSRFNAPDQPVVGVSWHDAVAYAEWAGKRLPTEAEWEKAARGGLVGKRYPWGDEAPDADGVHKANYYIGDSGAADGYAYAAPVGGFAPNGYGLYGMAGNVWEWCIDLYDVGYYANSPPDNPLGPDSGSYRVLRGGSWSNNPFYLRVALRVYNNPPLTYNYVGFRCVSQD